jgi:hypothetical protein
MSTAAAHVNSACRMPARRLARVQGLHLFGCHQCFFLPFRLFADLTDLLVLLRNRQ